MDLLRSRFLATVFLFALSFTYANAQYVVPSNFSSMEVSVNHVTMALVVNDNASQNVALEPLTVAAGRHDNSTNSSSSSEKSITGSLQLTTPDSYYNLQKGNIPYVSCDQSSYPGLFDVNRMLDTVAGDNPQAIILFSKSASGCSLTPNSGFSFQMLYSMTNSNEGSAIQTGLLNRQQISAQIGPDNSNSNSSSGNNNNSGGNGGNGAGTPTTAVAMIILYSVTGVITALFLLIIVTGAVRAHRHPERYGPRNVLGRTRQSRARGLARAMLDTIPIVKFGEAHEQPKPADQDVELANTAGQPGNETTATGGGTKHGGIESAAEVVATPSDGASTTMPGASASHDPASHDQVQPVSSADHLEEHQPATNSNEEGLTCSICTDEFVKGQDIRVLPCNHKFHPECVDPWLLNVSGTCPLCRIDLRPTTSRTSENDRQESDSHDHGRNGLPPPLAADAETATGGPGNRSSRRFSAFIHQTLGPSRMQDATAEERIAVLRRFRDHWRQNNETSASDRNGSGVAPNYPDGEQDRSTRQRLNARFRDTFHIRTRRRDSMLVGATHDQHGPTASSASNNDQPPPEVNGDPASRV